MQENMQRKENAKKEDENKPLSETIANAHSSGDGAIRLSEDGLIEPTGETIADAEAHKEGESKREEY
jgi:hypothetical protein